MENCGHHSGDAIKQHLDDEEPGEHRSDRSQGISINRVGGGEGVQPEDQRGERHLENCEQYDAMNGNSNDSMKSALVFVGASLLNDERGEHRDQGCGEHSTDNEVVHNVWRFIRQFVGIRKRILADNICEDDTTKKPCCP